MRRIQTALFFCLLALLSFSVNAQETTSEIQGTVMDGNTPISGATIIAIHKPSGTRYVTTSRKDGRYNLPNVRVGGPYKITASFVGYAEQVQDDISLSLVRFSTVALKWF